MNPLRDTPSDVIEKLTRWGGRNEYREPNWRVILAENHLVQRAGVWTEFADGTTSVEFTGVDYGYETRHIQPDSVKIGVFWVPLYPCTGWILERWFPPSVFGSRADWEAAKSQDGITPMMGPFPERGDYFMVDGMGAPWKKIPNLEMIRMGIAQWENSSEHTHGRMDEERLLKAINDAERAANEREEATYQAFLKETEYAVQHNLGFIKGHTALSGFRNRLARREGIQGHI